MWFYSTFALNMLEPWENALLRMSPFGPPSDMDED